MKRTLIALAALSTAVLLAAPAFAQDSIKVDLAGKAPAAKFATLIKAARAVCRAEPGMDIYNVFGQSECVNTTIATAVDRLGDAALSQYATQRQAFLALSTN